MKPGPLGRVDLALEETGTSPGSVSAVKEVGRQDEQSAIADGVGGAAVDLGAVARVVGDAAQVLEVLGVAEERGADNLVLDSARKLGEGVANHGGPLAARVMKSPGSA